MIMEKDSPLDAQPDSGQLSVQFNYGASRGGPKHH